MLCREMIAVCTEIHTKHINAVCGQNVEFLNGKFGDTLCNNWALIREVSLHLTDRRLIEAISTPSH